ncbi:tetracycline efflux Na+/H+ antiporter family transporter Tet(35) [Vallitalea longa]|uniref:Tetracycline efflux Na+/H+ antiporter family transporter Tet(35) n=1 Tax=Vallitalea longa TaxID=2936439 RepID=A0A9W5YCR5_9FIRM|nr:Na+/H+ antiporter NhaC family protein [Vallitalea longa]GKX29978.1 tetracycline efflux Na+/H+ antiporter family transporter Tet(35) [Vallitalea longa]
MELLLSLVPALIMIILVIITKKVIMSLSVGILIGSLIAHSFNVLESISYIGTTIWDIITDFSWHMPIVGFLLLLGIITTLLTITNSTKAFADFAVSKIKNKKAAQIVAWLLGIVIFIDDYFNALVIGEVSKPITDRYSISRAKLSYIIDSTSAPVVILLPISTWGAYIIGILTDVFKNENYTVTTGTGAYWQMIPMQFYAIVALIMVFIVIKFNINIGKMKTYEINAEKNNDISCSQSAENISHVKPVTNKGSKWALIITIISLIVLILGGMLYDANWDISKMLTVDITLPLFRGSVITTVIAIIFAVSTREVSFKHLLRAAKTGIGSMLPASIILITAWTLVEVIDKLNTGQYLADWIVKSQINPSLLIPIMFLIGGFIAFMTGTSWGTFGLLLPIAGKILAVSSPALMLPAMAAVLSGAILGDHCSPISDTTVLSATGAQAKLDAHFTSQLPYALISGLISFIAFITYGLTESLLISYVVIIVEFIIFIYIIKKISKPITN